MTRRALVVPSVLLALAFVGCGDKGAPDTKAGNPPAGNPKPAGPADAASAGGYGYAANLGNDLDKKVGDSLKKARKFLLAQRDDATGMFKAQGPVVGFTAIATMALIASTARESVAADPTIGKSLEFIASKQKADGAIAGDKQDWANYETSASICAFANARVAKFSAVQAKARDYVLSLQIQGDEKDVNFGGFPYEKEGDIQDTSDLSNAQYAAAAAHDAGVTDKAFWARLVKFLDRSQNRSEGNDSVVKVKVGDVEKQAVSGNDGGAGYGPGKSKAGWIERPDGKVEPRSYGSMTYALLKCLLYAGVKTDDPRVTAAVAWLSKNFTVERNPGFESDKDPKKGMQGYYYFLETMSRALAEYEKTTGKALVVTDAAGKPHDWRKELSAKIVSLQKADGTWSNEQDRWEEGSPLLVTSYMVEALATCQGRLP
jgi:squalene-hopene/tetraprenyl-beta-curcumene cyclase